MHMILVHAQHSCACTSLLCMQKTLVHAQDSCACSRILCMHNDLVHAQESCACTRFLSMHKITRFLCMAQDSCACTQLKGFQEKLQWYPRFDKGTNIDMAKYLKMSNQYLEALRVAPTPVLTLIFEP